MATGVIDFSLLSIITQEMVSYFEERTHYHINKVNEYGKKIGRDYTFHDLDKMKDNLIAQYVILTWSKKPDVNFLMTPELNQKIQQATFSHIKANEHHPEYWVEDVQLNSPEARNCIEPSKMPDEAILEMCADWCACSEENKSDPFDWFKQTKDKRWKWSEYQEKLILETLKKMWDND